MKIRVMMCNLYLKDRLRNEGWGDQKFLQRIKTLVMVIIIYQIKFWAILAGKYNYLRQVEFVLTTRCSLRCKNCANLMQYYSRPYDVEKRNILQAFQNLIKDLDEINTVVLVGGEPLLYENISDVIECVAKSAKVNHIDIFTNGTIVPEKSAVSVLQNPKVKIIISDYGEISRKKCELQAYCERNKINCYLKNQDLYWGYVGSMQARNRTKKQLTRQFHNCHNYCRSILNGKLFYCPRAAHGDDLGYVSTSKEEYVDLLKENVSVRDICRIVYSDHFFSACDYCNYGTKDMVPVRPGVQVCKGEKKEIS